MPEPDGTGASSQPNGQAPPPTPGDQTPKFEIRDGAWYVGGHKVVRESDLIAAKESLQRQAEQAQGVHNSVIDKARLDLSEAQTSLAAANAKVKELEQARQSGAAPQSTEEAAKLKVELESARKEVGDSSKLALELRTKLIVATYPGQVTAEQLASKTPAQLDAFEEALKALATSRGGPGPYATGAGGSGTQPLSDMERARRVLDATAIRGTRTANTK